MNEFVIYLEKMIKYYNENFEKAEKENNKEYKAYYNGKYSAYCDCLAKIKSLGGK